VAKAIHAVVIDDNKDDLFIATRLLGRAGIKDITQFSGIPEAIVFLEDIAEGIRPCPDLVDPGPTPSTELVTVSVRSTVSAGPAATLARPITLRTLRGN